MSIPIILSAGGVAGWKLLQRTEGLHLDTVARDPIVQRQAGYFQDNISKATSAEALVKDYQLLNVALSAFGLETDIANKAFITKVLESDLSDDRSLANRLSDKRYLRLAEAFGYGAESVNSEALRESIPAAYIQREFERRIGEGNENLRLALNARRELEDMAGRESSDRTLWFEVLGNPPLRKVFEGAFGFGEHYGKLPIDRQHEEFTKAAERMFGAADFSRVTQADVVDRLVQNFLARSQMTTSPVSNRYSAALTLLSRMG